MPDQARAGPVAKNQLQSPAFQPQGRKVFRQARHSQTVPGQLFLSQWRTARIHEELLKHFPGLLRCLQTMGDLGANPVDIQCERKQPCNNGEHNKNQDQLYDGEPLLAIFGQAEPR